jgi:hypothetical protein
VRFAGEPRAHSAYAAHFLNLQMVIRAAAAGMLATLFAAGATAQTWPAKTVRIIVPFAPGIILTAGHRVAHALHRCANNYTRGRPP